MTAEITRAHRALYLVVACAAGAYALARAALVPIVHDECASLLWFVRPGEWLPYLAHWDANNHYLNSGSGILFTSMFGGSLLALRAGSLLAFAIYAWGAWRLGAHVRTGLVRACLWAALLLCPFLSDFFALFRGYGIELAAWLVSVDGLLRFAGSKAQRHIVQALSGLLLANAAIVALLPAWAVVLVLLALLTWHGRSAIGHKAVLMRIAAWLSLGLLPIALATAVALELKERGLLYHGGTEGFFDVTLVSLCRYVIGTPHGAAALLPLMLLVLSSGIAVREALKNRELSTPLLVVNVLLWSDVLLRVVMARGMGVNYPEDRAALHFVPLAILSIALGIDRSSEERPWAKWCALLLLLLPVRTLWTANLDHTLAWPEQSVPQRFLHLADARGRALDRPLLVGAQHQLALAWPMGSWLLGLPPRPVQTFGFPEGAHDLRIADERTLHEAMPGYHVIDSAMGPGLWLLERDRPLTTDPPVKSDASARSGREEFMELAHLPLNVLQGGNSVVEVSVPLIIPSRSPDVRLVVEVNDQKGEKLFYDSVAPLTLGPGWTGQRLCWAWGLPPMPRADRAIVYLYDPTGMVVSHGFSRTLVSAVR